MRKKIYAPFLRKRTIIIDLTEDVKNVLAFLFWGGALVVAGALTGFIGAGIVVTAFIAWIIILKIRREQKGINQESPEKTDN